MADYELYTARADYPPWSGPPARTLVICTQQRSGSTLLGEAIYFAGGLGCPLEYLHPGFRPALEDRWRVQGLKAYIDQLHRLRTDRTGTFSIKLFWRDLQDLADEVAPGEFPDLRGSPSATSAASYRRLFDLLADILPDPSWVLLLRHDGLRQAVSNFVAWRTASWRKTSGETEPRRREVDYDPVLIRRFLTRVLRHNAHWRNFFQENGLPFEQIAYEDLERDYFETLRAFFVAIGSPDAALRPPRLYKQADDASETLVGRFRQDMILD